MASTTATRTAGTLGSQRCRTRIRASAADPDRSAARHRLAVGDALDEAGGLVDEAVGVDREAEQLGQLADQDGQGQPVHVADHGSGLRQQVGDEAELGDAGQRS